MISALTFLTGKYSMRTTGTVGLCIGVVFGTAASLLRNDINRYIGGTPSSTTMSYMTGSAVSLMAILSIRNLLLDVPSATSTTATTSTTAAAGLSPLQHLRVLNYQPRSISSSILSTELPLFVHRRCA